MKKILKSAYAPLMLIPFGAIYFVLLHFVILLLT